MLKRSTQVEDYYEEFEKKVKLSSIVNNEYNMN